MNEIIELGNISISVTRKAIKNVHLSVHPPDGRVTLSAPRDTRAEVVRAYAISKIGWIRDQKEQLQKQLKKNNLSRLNFMRILLFLTKVQALFIPLPDMVKLIL